MTPAEQRKAAAAFAAFWKDKGSERGQSQPFWLSLLRDVFGVEHPEAYIEFEDKANIDRRHGFIDGYIPATRVMVEQKSLGKSLTQGIVQADGSVLTPFQQAKRYCIDLPVTRHPRWVVCSNFESFQVFDMDKPNAEPETILLSDLPREYYRLAFLVQTEADYIKKEEEVSKKAGAIVGKIYDKFLAQYANPEDPATLESLNQLCVRLVFCWFCEDSEVFGHNQFANYLKRFPARDARRALIDLFKVLDTPEAKRDKYLDAELKNFSYVNGGLFKREDLEIPQLTEELQRLIVEEGSGFDWRQISPTIFGSIFEGTLNPETRRQGGMHYSTLEAIHKVIDPLFLNRLTKEIDRIAAEPDPSKRAQLAEAFIVKLSKLRFLDPAAGSGNFLTESYICLRRLENRALAIKFDAMRKAGMYQSELNLGEGVSVRVSIKQFFGIEINGFARAVATSAMFISELKMQKETEAVLSASLPSLPLRDYAGMIEGNALRMDWATICPEGFDFIFGNPPFVGAKLKTEEQRADCDIVFDGWDNHGILDYVCGWFKLAGDYMREHNCRSAFVATNSLCQGEIVGAFWKPFLESGIKIDFAHRTFKWSSDSDNKAAVHCVIVGFHYGAESEAQKILFDGGRVSLVPHINAYLLAASDVFVESHNAALCESPQIGIGNKPIDGGNYLFTPEEKAAFLAKEPSAESFFRLWLGSEEFINRIERWCLWLGECPPEVLRSMPLCLERVARVRDFRLASKSAPTRKLAETPTRFHIENFPKGNSILIPKVSSERRRYIPMGFVPPSTLCSDLVFLLPGASLYHFGVLSSNVHNAWARAVGGRLKSDYRYSAKIVYNNYPWVEVTEEQRDKIAKTAQGILDARAKYPNASLAALYDQRTMPIELIEAHRENDRAVMSAYGFPRTMSESDCVAALFERYKALVASKGK